MMGAVVFLDLPHARLWTIWGASWWDAFQAIGTLLAVVTALGLAIWEAWRTRRALRSEKVARDARERVATASLVSSWVEISYEPSDDGTHYLRGAEVFVANESNEPVFDVHVRIGIGDPVVQIGPLAVPVPIPVLPPRRQRSWDVSLGLLAHSRAEGELPSEPVARVDFSDARSIRWNRDYSGQLGESEVSDSAHYELDPEIGEAQLGDLENFFNPMSVAVAFCTMLGREDPSCSVDDIRGLLAEDAAGWGEFGSEDLESMRGMVAGCGLAAHVWYPAPRVAYVRLPVDEDAVTPSAAAGYAQIRGQLLTLTFRPDLGWRIFSVGEATAPDWIEFPAGSLDAPIR